MKVLTFLRDYTLPLCMALGVCLYLTLAGAEWVRPYKAQLLCAVEWVQPVLIFAMLFISFCKIRPSELRFSPWQGWLLLVQCGVFLLSAAVLLLLPRGHWAVVVEALMICFVCPTATAAVVVTGRLGGHTGSLTLYTIMANLAASVLIPAVVPLIHPEAGDHFLSTLVLILRRVFPTLMMPLALALALQRLCPQVVRRITSVQGLAFYLWAVALCIAIAATTRTLVHTHSPLAYQAGIALASVVACVAQFALGKRLGRKYGQQVSAAQAMGQKNTILAIWVASSFFTPITSLAGGFYSVWHNLYNSYQLYRARHSAPGNG